MPSEQEITQVGKHEDLSDILAIADAKGTPVTTMIPKGPAPENTLYEWIADGYDDPKTTGVVDGKDVSSYEDAGKKRKKLQGRVQLFRRAPRVSTLGQKVSRLAGAPNPFDRAKAKKIIETKRDIETRVLSNLDSQADDGAEQGYEFRGLGKWIDPAEQGELPVPSDYRTPAASVYTGTLASFTDDSFSGILQSRYEQTGTSDQLKMIPGTDVKRAISNLSRYDVDKASNGHVRHFNQDASEGTLFNKIDVYDSDFGYVEILPASLFMPTAKTAYILDFRMLEFRPHTLPYFRELEDRGGGRNGLVDAIIGLSVLNPLAHAKIAAS